ncbi:hypothetical protein IX317_001712 [Fusobacterium sp. DD29]|uniref:DUF4438 domain-containing protein n=1 Tax=unclassified Fusobacterium TaxID=2648384 RepID=UPI001D3A0195|nr:MULTISPECIES: DUF4438 domain-containing protein [unclassified Fusobacterium]MBR8711313.1 hypothetical protein [Fusobacterium sp. DD28]MBR8750031.1 hypothetical protein [Fusobacterium sp. DD29]MBR8751853.1 hypothetical protein [Fusobacterium sp. DD26]MBR8762273.1 hypothetical protein [Fusobacterium sp. DD25]MBR8768589.1 hypothetical protein [Fusobacterium sp. DD43]
MMIKTNRDCLVMQSVGGKVHSPAIRSPYRISRDGKPMILPATGGISYNVKVGDSCMKWVGDHVEPGVSIRNEDVPENNALMVLGCIGNTAKVVSGDAKGAIGFVTGGHGGIEHTLIYFDEETLEKLSIDDKILVKAFGQGLAIDGFEDVTCMNIDPDLLEKMDIKVVDGVLEVPVVTEIPPYLMGSGVGSATAFSGDYDIMTGDKEANEKYGINNLRFGDIVLLRDCNNTYGRDYLKGSVTIGVIVHSDCIKAGHGPGVTAIMSCPVSKIKGRIDKNANIAYYMGVMDK